MLRMERWHSWFPRESRDSLIPETVSRLVNIFPRKGGYQGDCHCQAPGGFYLGYVSTPCVVWGAGRGHGVKTKIVLPSRCARLFYYKIFYILE